MADDRVSVSRSVEVPADIRDVWAVVGDFHGLDKWHPAVASSTREHVTGEEFRALDLEGGGRIVEHLEGETGHSYDYAILRGPLPVAHYHARIEATNTGGGTQVTWSSSFVPTSEDAEQVIAGVYEAGLGALKERFAG